MGWRWRGTAMLVREGSSDKVTIKTWMKERSWSGDR